jgi:hypothetical protein
MCVRGHGDVRGGIRGDTLPGGLGWNVGGRRFLAHQSIEHELHRTPSLTLNQSFQTSLHVRVQHGLAGGRAS